MAHQSALRQVPLGYGDTFFPEDLEAVAEVTKGVAVLKIRYQKDALELCEVFLSCTELRRLLRQAEGRRTPTGNKSRAVPLKG